MALRVVLAEDNYLVREGVGKLIDLEDDLEVVAVCADYPSLVKAVDLEVPDVVVTDIRMPPTGTDEGIRAANELRGRYPDMGVVVLSQYSEPAYALQFLESGSKGRAYLLKERISDIGQLASADPRSGTGRLRYRPRGGRQIGHSPLPGCPLTAARAYSPRGGGPRRDGAGQEQRGRRCLACAVGTRRLKSTSTPSSSSSG